jgi:hypothetical protein
VLRARLGLAKRAVLDRIIDQEPLQALLGEYKNLEHDMVTLADMATDKTCRDMLVERLGLKRWRILDGGGPQPERLR